MSEREYLTCAEADELRLSADPACSPPARMFHGKFKPWKLCKVRISWASLPDGRTLEERFDTDGCRHWIEAP